MSREQRLQNPGLPHPAAHAQFMGSLRPSRPKTDSVSPARALGLHLKLGPPSPQASAVSEV